jgi:hypothetical protein
VKGQKNRFEALRWMITVVCILIGICGCDLIDLEREWIQIHFDLEVYAYSSYTGTSVPGAYVYLRAQKCSYEDHSRIPGTDIFVDRQTYKGGTIPWEFDYELLYDNEENKYMEFVVVDVYARFLSLSGSKEDSVAGWLKIYPSGGGWPAASLKFNEGHGSIPLERKIIVRVPLKVRSILD